jgi:hypothetical protein
MCVCALALVDSAIRMPALGCRLPCARKLRAFTVCPEAARVFRVPGITVWFCISNVYSLCCKHILLMYVNLCAFLHCAYLYHVTYVRITICLCLRIALVVYASMFHMCTMHSAAHSPCASRAMCAHPCMSGSSACAHLYMNSFSVYAHPCMSGSSVSAHPYI